LRCVKHQPNQACNAAYETEWGFDPQSRCRDASAELSAPPNPTVPARKFWLVSKNAPKAERVDKDAPAMSKPRSDLPEVSYGNWVTSSYDLLDGVEVTEDPDTIPDELFDELFVPKQGSPKKPGN
jgi:hypothetical protein